MSKSQRVKCTFCAALFLLSSIAAPEFNWGIHRERRARDYWVRVKHQWVRSDHVVRCQLAKPLIPP